MAGEAKTLSDLVVVYRDPRALAPYARNARTHSAEQIKEIRASIREFGFTNPVLLKDDERTIGAGHARTRAALDEGMERIPTITLPGLTETQWRAYVIADNKLALNAGWNEALLKLEFEDLKLTGFDLTLTGFSLDDIAALDMLGGQSGAGSLSEQFMIAPFSVLNAREGWWQDRKRAWLALGIQSELGRGETNNPQRANIEQDAREPIRRGKNAIRPQCRARRLA